MGESGVLKKELLMLLFVVVKSLDDGGLQAVGWGWSGDLKMLIIKQYYLRLPNLF